MIGEREVIVIMPVGSDPAHASRAAAISTGLTRANLKPSLPSYDAADPQFSLAAFFIELRAAYAVLADLTGERPSCYFELGFAEALGKPTKLFATEGTTIHQSSHRDEILFYRDYGRTSGPGGYGFLRPVFPPITLTRHGELSKRSNSLHQIYRALAASCFHI